MSTGTTERKTEVSEIRSPTLASSEEIETIKARRDAATPGPYERGPDVPNLPYQYSNFIHVRNQAVARVLHSEDAQLFEHSWSDIGLLLSTVEAMAKQIDSLNRAIKMRDTFLKDNAAAMAFAHVTEFLDIMFTGAKGRQMTADEAIEIIKEINSDREAMEGEIELLENSLRRYRNGDDLPDGWKGLDVGDGFPNLYVYSRADVIEKATAELAEKGKRIEELTRPLNSTSEFFFSGIDNGCHHSRLHADCVGCLAGHAARMESAVRELEAELAAIRAQREWQPIESEPKDDSKVLMLWPDGHVQIEVSHKEDGKTRFWFEEAPTYWLPLTALPTPPTNLQP